MDVNTSIPLLEPVASTIQTLMKTISVFVGGIFGLYVIMFLWGLYRYKKDREFFKRMKKDIENMNYSMVRLDKKIDGLKRAQADKKDSKKRK